MGCCFGRIIVQARACWWQRIWNNVQIIGSTWEESQASLPPPPPVQNIKTTTPTKAGSLKAISTHWKCVLSVGKQSRKMLRRLGINNSDISILIQCQPPKLRMRATWNLCDSSWKWGLWGTVAYEAVHESWLFAMSGISFPMVSESLRTEPVFSKSF